MTSPLAQLAVHAKGSPGKKTVLFLHGFLGSARDWEFLVNELANTHYTLALDLPGHGNSATVAENLYPMPACAEAIVQELGRREIKQASLAAYSMGGRLAWYLVTHYPDRFDRALIESSSPGMEDEADRAARRDHDGKLAQQLERDGIGPFLVFWYRQALFASLAEHPERLKELVNGRLNNDPAGLARSLHLMGTGAMPNCWPLISRIKAKLLLVTGEQDRKFCDIAERIVDLCPTAQHRIIEQCGHAVHVERPARLVALAREFFS